MKQPSPYTHYYAFAAKGIQDFILQGNQLKLMIGGSELIEQMPNTFLSNLLRKLDLVQNADYQVLSRNAGGARLLFANEDAAKNLVKLLPMAINLYAPGLDFVQVVLPVRESLAKTMATAEMKLQERRNLLFPKLPVAGPMVLRAPRSGLPAVDSLAYHNEPDEAVDASALARRHASENAASSLLKKIFPDETRQMARHVEKIGSEHDYLALLHADGNGLGQLVMKLLQKMTDQNSLSEAATQYRTFSESIEKATTAAMKEALEPLLQTVSDELPFRILICAGDDVTVLLNARDAVGVTQRFLESFERKSLEEFNNTGIVSLANQHLTACAGLVFMHQKFPFGQAYELCESLCKYTKDATRREASAIAFRRITSSTTPDYSSILKRELTTAEGIQLTLGAYAVGERVPDFPTLAQLLDLQNAMDAMPRGSLRGLIDEISISRSKAEQALQRIETVSRQQENDTFSMFKDSLHALTEARDGQSVLWKTPVKSDNPIRTPLYDALELSAATGRKTVNQQSEA